MDFASSKFYCIPQCNHPSKKRYYLSHVSVAPPCYMNEAATYFPDMNSERHQQGHEHQPAERF
jgi:hypothetical protein